MVGLVAFTQTDKTTHNSHKFGFKLSPTNYGHWKTMVQPFLVTNELFGYIDGTIICPPPTTPAASSEKNKESSSTTEKNVEHLIWIANDAHVRMLLLSTMSESVFQHVQGLTSRDLWLSLERAYAPRTSSREYTLKTQLLKLTMKPDESSSAYLTRAQEYADALANIGEPVKDKDLVMLVLSGLREEYNGLKSNALARSTPITFVDLHSLLSDHDYMITKNSATTAPAQAFTAATTGRSLLTAGSSSTTPETVTAIQQLVAQLGFKLQPLENPPQAFYSNRSSNNRGSQNRTGYVNSRGRGRGSRQPAASSGGIPSQFRWASNQNTVYGSCNRCGIGHVPSQCPHRDPNTVRSRQPPSANYTDTRPMNTTSWLPNTESNQHVAPDLSAFDTSEAYYGEDNLHVGNGKAVPILHIGSTIFHHP